MFETDHGPESIVTGVIWNLGAKSISLALGAVLSVLLPRWLTPTGFGHYAQLASAVALFALLADFGVGASNARYVASYGAQCKEALPSVIASGLLLNIVFSLALGLACFVLAPFIVDFVGGPRGMEATLRLGSLLVLAISVKDFVGATFQGLFRMDLMSITNTIGNVGRVVLSLVFVGIGLGVTGALLGWILGYGIACVAGGYLLHSQFGRVRPRPDRKLVSQTLRYAIPLGLIGLAFYSYTQADTLLVGKYLGTDQAGYYGIPLQVSTWLSFPAAALGMTVAPVIARRFESGKPVGNMLLTSMKFVLLIFIPLATTIAVMAHPIVVTAYGQDYLPTVPVLRVYMPFLVLFAISAVLSQVLNFLGKAAFRGWVLCSIAIIKLALGVLLIPTSDITGAAWITLSTYCVVIGAYWYVLSRLCCVSNRSFVALVVKIMAAAGVMGLLQWQLLSLSHGLGALIGIAAVSLALFVAIIIACRVITVTEIRTALRRFPVVRA